MRILLASAAIAIVAGCATAAKITLQDRFQAIGLSADMAGCMVDDLENRLSSEDIQDLARYTIGLSRANSPQKAIQSLMEIDNPRAVAAIGRSGLSCVTGFGL